MNTMPFDGAKVKVVGHTLVAFKKAYQGGNFCEINEWIVVGVGKRTKSGESMVLAKNVHNFLGGQVCQFFKSELEEFVAFDDEVKEITAAMVGKKDASGYSQLNKSCVYGNYYIDGAQEMEDGSLRIWVSNIDGGTIISFVSKEKVDCEEYNAENYEGFFDKLYNHVKEYGDLSFDTWK